jgi:flagellin-specific chaperone FliS
MVAMYCGNSSQLQSYRTNAVASLGPAQLMLRMYDMAVADLQGGDGAHACKVIGQLIESLDFTYPETAGGLFRLYRYCLEQTKQGEYSVPARIMDELRQTWREALARG